MRTINYESDFKLIESFKDGSSIYEAPFRFTYYTKLTRGSYVAEYDGVNFTNCRPTEDGNVIVPFDSPKLGMGVLMVKREFFLNDSDYKDGICNLVSVENTGITLDKGATDDLGEIELLVEPYYHVVGSGGVIPSGSVTTSKIKDGAVTEDKLSEEVKEKLNSGGYEPPVEGIPYKDLSKDVQESLDKANSALQEHQSLEGYIQLKDIQPIENDVDYLKGNMLTSEATDDVELPEDYILMVSDIAQGLSDDENKAISPKAVKTALQEMIVSTLNTPI